MKQAGKKHTTEQYPSNVTFKRQWRERMLDRAAGEIRLERCKPARSYIPAPKHR